MILALLRKLENGASVSQKLDATKGAEKIFWLREFMAERLHNGAEQGYPCQDYKRYPRLMGLPALWKVLTK